jgi:peroxiredoxin/outer membrane murein-binding lipoprotein Lpp
LVRSCFVFHSDSSGAQPWLRSSFEGLGHYPFIAIYARLFCDYRSFKRLSGEYNCWKNYKVFLNNFIKENEMKNRITLYAVLVGATLLTGCSEAPTTNTDEVTSALPNYADAVVELEKKLYGGEDAIKVGDQDMAVITKAAADLSAQMPDPGIKIGEKAPDFALKNPFGKTVKLKSVLEKGPIVLTFYRGAWCPYCNLQMHQLQTSLSQFKQHGATILAVTPQKPDKSLAQFKKDGYPFEVLSDLDYKVIKSYGLYWEVSPELDAVYKQAFGLDVTDFNGEGRRGLPIPGTFVIDQTGIVRAAFAETDYTKRMEPAAILAALRQLTENKMFSKK